MSLTIHGTCPDQFAPIREAFAKNFSEDNEIGASFALSKDGEMLVDIWAGHLDEERSKPWQEDTIVNVYSTTKTMSFLCMLLLADRGELDFSDNVARYWPEFAANGKAEVKISHLMAHAAGLSGLDKPSTEENVYDQQWMAEALASQAPWWQPGSASGYHALTQGHLLGEVVKRVTGMTLGQFLRQELAAPLGADFHIGTPQECDSRIGNLIPPAAATIAEQVGADADSIAARTFASPAVNAKASWTTAWRRAELPAANGHGNARSVVQLQTLIANGGWSQGQQLLSEAGARRALERQTSGTDLVLGVPVDFGLGYGLRSDLMPISPNKNACFWGGWGGSSIVNDLDARVCFAYVMNRMDPGALGDSRGARLNKAVFDSLQ